MTGYTDATLALFAASTVVIFVYALLCLIYVGISLAMIYKGRQEFSKGHMRRFINGLSITLAVSFLYAVWNVLTKMKAIKLDNVVLASLLDNIILIIFIMLLTYLAFLSRGLSKKFGFKSIGKKISEMARKK